MSSGTSTNRVERDGRYFLRLLDEQATRISGMADQTEQELLNKLPEHAVGKIRSATGMARLLVNKKMDQFKELCLNNLNQLEAEQCRTTIDDLEAFWDIVMMQVKQVDMLFDEILTLKRNNWRIARISSGRANPRSFRK